MSLVVYGVRRDGWRMDFMLGELLSVESLARMPHSGLPFGAISALLRAYFRPLPMKPFVRLYSISSQYQ